MADPNIWNDLVERVDALDPGFTPENVANKDTDATFAANSDVKYPSQKAVKTAVDLKAPLASPTFTGTPAAPTASAGTNTTQLATTAFVKAAIDVVLGGVSSAFDTLAEIATALAAKFGGSVTTGVVPKATGSFALGDSALSFSGNEGIFADNLRMNGAGAQAWTNGKAMYGPTSALFFGNSGDVHFTSNCMVDSTAAHGWRYVTTGPAVDFYLFNGNCVVRKIGSGSAGADLDWSTGSSITLI